MVVLAWQWNAFKKLVQPHVNKGWVWSLSSNKGCETDAKMKLTFGYFLLAYLIAMQLLKLILS